jgi:oxygen-dependent protoporphyrinogen oxidase
MSRRVVIVGGGITGLTVAERLSAVVDRNDVEIEVLESSERVGGKLRTTAFAGRPGIDEGADAFLVRVPAAAELARRVGLAETLTAPTGAHAAVWHDGLHRIPDGLVLGVPSGIAGLAASGLLSVRGKLRAAVEPLLPRTRDPGDSIGRLVRARFGAEVHERLVDALVGSIYGADTDRFSLAMVPQLAELAAHRSILLAARSLRHTRRAAEGPVFLAPLDGMEALAIAARDAALERGTSVHTGAAVTSIERDGAAWRVDGRPAEAVVLATPAAASGRLVRGAVPDLAAVLGQMDHAGVVIVTLAIAEWPERLRGYSGYLVPKPRQALVTAASFGSQKWQHWQGSGELLRVSLGRDGLDVMDRHDDEIVAAAVAEVGSHVGLDLQPEAVRVSRWPAAFPQYRPGHQRWLDAVDAAAAPGLFLAGASYRGIGIPACIADAERVATDVIEFVRRG